MPISLWPGGPTLQLSDHWQPLRTLPDDPRDTQVFAVTVGDGAAGFLMMLRRRIRNRRRCIAGTRWFRGAELPD
jgi:hypothetical protein